MTDEVARIAAVLRPIVNDWFDTGYEAGKLDANVLAERIAGLRVAPDLAEGRRLLAEALAYALVRAARPSAMETSGDYAERLAPLVIESGYIRAEALLAGTPDLDVDRLARAWHRAFHSHKTEPEENGNDAEFAGRLAREYARLRGT